MQEADFWVDRPLEFFTEYEDIDELITQHTNFTTNGVGVGLLMIFLGSKYPINEEYVKALCSEQFDAGANKPLIADLMEKLNIWMAKFSMRYEGDIY